MTRRWALGFALILAAAAPARATPVGPTVVERRLASGAALLVSEQRTLPIVQVHVLIDAGARHDPPQGAGLASLAAGLVTKGTERRSAEEISDAIDFVGGDLSAQAGMDSAAVSLKVLRKDLDLGLDLLADVLLRPTFAATELERRRESMLASIRSAEDNPAAVADKAFRAALFGAEPYGHPVIGTRETVAALDRSAVRAFYQRHWGPRGAAVVVVGDIGADEIEALLEARLGAWADRGAPAFVYPTPGADEPRSVLIDRPVAQAAIVLGQRGVPRAHPEYEALEVMNYILGGGGFSSRLMDKIRTEAGLVYSVYSDFDAQFASGSFAIAMQTKNDKAREAIALARAEVARMRDGVVSAEELRDAKRYLTGSYPLKLDSSGKIASFIAEVWFFGLGFDYVQKHLEKIETVSLEDVQRVAREYLQPDKFLEVVVADLAAAGLQAPPVPVASP